MPRLTRSPSSRLLSCLSIGATVAFVGLAPAASATSTYMSQIPNAPNSCDTCHTNGGGSARNDFGLDVEANIVSAAVDWSSVYSLDSDGDGQTNGEELGDPCGIWSTGDPPRSTDISDPADDTDTSADPDTGCDADVDPPDPAAPGCGGANATNEGTPMALALLGAAAVLLMRRRRR